MRIVQVLGASTGGIGRHVASLAPRLAERGHQVIVVAPPLTAAAHDFGVELRSGLSPCLLRSADVVHAHGYKAGAQALATLVASPVPSVVTWHNAVLGSGGSAAAGRLLQRVVARGADLTLGASEDLVTEAARLGARCARLGAVAAPALAVATRSAADVRAELRIAATDTVVLTVSRLAPQKNLGMVLDVAARLRAAPIRFVVAGDGPQRRALAERIDDEGLRVALLGARDDVADLLGAADLVLLTSTWEARALVAQEALQAGVPLVSTAVGGIPGLVGDAAALVALGDADAAAAAVRELATDSAHRAELRERGRTRAATWPDEDAVAADVLAAYAEAGASVSGSAGPTG